jgi:tyrosyl-tRNA synthetase
MLNCGLLGDMLQEAPDTRHAQKVLAEQVTVLVHGGKIHLSRVIHMDQ